MAQRPAFDLTKLSSADKIIGLGAGIFFVWSILPIWYKGGYSGWWGVTIIAGVASLLALLALMSDAMGWAATSRRGAMHLVLGGLGFLFTILGAALKPDFSEVNWGLWVALLWAIVWGYGGYMKMVEGGAIPPAEGGFTA